VAANYSHRMKNLLNTLKIFLDNDILSFDHNIACPVSFCRALSAVCRDSPRRVSTLSIILIQALMVAANYLHRMKNLLNTLKIFLDNEITTSYLAHVTSRNNKILK